MDLTDLTDLTPAERRVRHAFPLGEGVDFREGDDDPGRGADWGPERTLRAEFLRELLPAGPVAQGRTAGLKMTGARVTGRLDLKYGTVTCAVRLRSCHFEQAPDLYGARLDDAVLDAPGGTALHAEVLTVGTDLHAMRLRARGRVNLSGARIPRQLNLAYVRLATPAATRCASAARSAASGGCARPRRSRARSICAALSSTCCTYRPRCGPGGSGSTVSPTAS
ncbi:hypothetical protein ABZ800_08860 [Streptomyces sp. NPDC047813]|uniref:hypothetical protein n=1 Tax=Streptomyces sp. NPDC047813 TaxID=3154608 RepID=UPI00341016F3